MNIQNNKIQIFVQPRYNNQMPYNQMNFNNSQNSYPSYQSLMVTNGNPTNSTKYTN